MKPLVHNVDINIHGKVYTIACPPGEESRLRQLADYLDDRVNKLALQFSNAGTSVSETKLLVMAGLMLSDELAETSNRLAETEEATQTTGLTREDTELLTTRIQRLATRINNIAEKVMA